mmetsp:Transcript_125154/g.249872  ORF Transcript_125154/g.249872 Transcript_125154/m.249872 type:complete len:233 (-) Transcript_125154:340-1038(-)
MPSTATSAASHLSQRTVTPLPDSSQHKFHSCRSSQPRLATPSPPAAMPCSFVGAASSLPPVSTMPSTPTPPAAMPSSFAGAASSLPPAGTMPATPPHPAMPSSFASTASSSPPAGTKSCAPTCTPSDLRLAPLACTPTFLHDALGRVWAAASSLPTTVLPSSCPASISPCFFSPIFCASGSLGCCSSCSSLSVHAVLASETCRRSCLPLRFRTPSCIAPAKSAAVLATPLWA